MHEESWNICTLMQNVFNYRLFLHFPQLTSRPSSVLILTSYSLRTPYVLIRVLALLLFHENSEFSVIKIFKVGCIQQIHQMRTVISTYDIILCFKRTLNQSTLQCMNVGVVYNVICNSATVLNNLLLEIVKLFTTTW